MTMHDLVLTLDAPPADAPDTTLATIRVAYPLAGLEHGGLLLQEPLTDEEREHIQWYLEEYWKWPYEEFKERGEVAENLIVELGKRLYNQAFGEIASRDILQAWRYGGDGPRRISIVSTLPRALSLPWELLHDAQGYLVLRSRNPAALVRRVPQSEGTGQTITFTPPLRVLLVTARPHDAGFVDPRSIARELYDATEDQQEAGVIAVEYLRPPTLAALQKRLTADPPIHVLHFDGHGVFGVGTGETSPHTLRGGETGKLAFETDDGGLDLVEADRLAQVLQHSGVQLAVLTACQSAISNEESALSSVAGRLVAGGVAGVVAMSASLLVVTAVRYVNAFYRALASGTAMPIAHERARQQLHASPERHLFQRRRDEPGEPIILYDWWLPHVYLQRELSFDSPTQAAPTTLPVATRTLTKFPHPPQYGFVGRAHELLDIERLLFQGKLVAVHGFGGQGKTTLATELADWLTRTGMYRGALFVGLADTGGGTVFVLGELARHLGCYDGDFDPHDTSAALARLRPLLKATPTLLVVDNVESVLERGEAPLPADERQTLWNLLLDLRAAGAGVLLTTRDVDFGTERLEPGRFVAHVSLGGLLPDEAYALSQQLLKDRRIPAARAPYVELMQLMAQIGYHPLALERVLPVLADTAMDTVLREFSALLTRFTGAGEGRNRSLLASLDYSLRRLTDAQRALLPRLALFEGGSLEPEILAVGEYSEEEWAYLRQGLEQAALLYSEVIDGVQHSGKSVPFLRFHPILAPYLRWQDGADDAALRQRYAARYAALAGYLYHEDDRNPLPVRALVRRELPNLRQGFALLREQGQLETAVEMAETIARFLFVFGLGRELAALREEQQTIAAALIAQGGDTLTQAEYLHESGQGEDEFNRGALQAAYERFMRLLQRIEAQPAASPRGPGSYAHALTLGRLARCLEAGGQPTAAEQMLRQALDLLAALLSTEPENRLYLRERGATLTDLGDVLMLQGRYAEARAAYEQGLEVDRKLGDERGQGVSLGQLGTLALMQREYAEAERRYREALLLFRQLHEPAMEAVAWHQLGRVAEEQRQWEAATNHYRESLALEERQGNLAGAARTCTTLGNVAAGAGRPQEAEGWHKRAISLNQQIGEDQFTAMYLNNLADLLTTEIRAGRMPRERLPEARQHAERALAIVERIGDLSLEPWKDYSLAAQIADLEGQTEQARAYRRRARETFAAFPGNRYHIDQQHGQRIAAIAAVALGDETHRAAIEEALPQLEARNWRIADATRRIWAGERDWHALCEDLDSQDSLLVRRVLEVVEDPAQAPAGSQGPDMAQVLAQFAPLLEAIAAVALGDDTHRAEVEAALPQLEQAGWRLSDPTRRIWAGERDEAALTAGLDGNSAALVRRVLEVVEGDT